MKVMRNAMFALLVLATQYVFGQEGGDLRRCAGDELAQHLLATYPNGVPGRKLPSMEKVHETDSNFTYIIPVVVHVMYALDTNNLGVYYPGPEYYITPEQIQSQIDVLNEGFGRYGEGFNDSPLGEDIGFKFCLVSKDPDGNPHPGYDYTPTQLAKALDPILQDTLLKQINQWDPNRYVNIWTVRRIPYGSGRLQGYTYIPEQVAGTIYDGLVISYESFGRDVGNATTRGKTGTHEMGHYFDLYHPWGAQASTTGFCPANSDYCDDTPPVPIEEFATRNQCNLFFETCDTSRRQIENYMDYSADECLNLFTHCQISRMRNALLTYRSEMVSIENLRSVGCATALDTTAAIGAISVYPNPATRYLMVNVDLEDVGQVRIEMYDLSGRRVWLDPSANVGRGAIPIDLTGFSQGSYQLIVSTSDQVLSTRIFVGSYFED